MLRTGIVIDARYRDHDAGSWHPERPDRIAALERLVAARPDGSLRRIEPRPATDAEITAVHTPGYLAELGATAGCDGHWFDPDTAASARSFDTALLAAGGLLELADAVMAGEVDNGFAFVRPPGHHAETDHAKGFCLLNNIAIAARHLERRHGVERLLLVDWDVHHGNGSQHAFEDEDGVLYVSTHQYPFYPGSGAAREVGRGAGEGFTVNLPLPAGCGDDELLTVFRDLVEPIASQYDPQLVLVSAGFDGHARDPLAGMRMTAGGYAVIARSVLRIAAEHAGNRFVAVLEGGYDLEALSDSVAAVLDEMTGERLADAPSPGGGADELVRPLRDVQRRFWELPAGR